MSIILEKIFTKDEKIEQIKQLVPKLTNPLAKSMLYTMGKTIIESGEENFDDQNNIDASDILANILSKNYDEILELLEEQLIDMYNLGQCPQGRTTRLWQIFQRHIRCLKLKKSNLSFK